MRLLYVASGPPPGDPLTEDDLVGLYRHPAPANRAWLRTNFVATLDGSIAGTDGRSGSINTASDQRVFALHRALADVVLVGAETVRAEGYRAVDLAGWQRGVRAREGLAPFPLLAVISGSLRIDPAIAAPPRDHGPVMIITSGRHGPEQVEPFRAAGIEMITQPGDRVDPAAVLSTLAGRGLPRVLCEGGPGLHRDLLAAGLVDELSLTLAPTAVGGNGSRTTSGPPLPEPPDFAVQHVHYAPEDETVFTTYRRRSA